MNGVKFGDIANEHAAMVNNTFYIVSDPTDVSLAPIIDKPMTLKLKAKGVSFAFTSDRVSFRE
jgi:hypothetical protein